MGFLISATGSLTNDPPITGGSGGSGSQKHPNLLGFSIEFDASIEILRSLRFVVKSCRQPRNHPCSCKNCEFGIGFLKHHPTCEV